MTDLYHHRVRRVGNARRAILGIAFGGAGRVGLRYMYRAVSALFGDEHNLGLVEIDLCHQTGRDSDASAAVPQQPGRLIVHLTEPINCRALVERYGTDRSYPIWQPVDPDTIKHVDDTSVLGGYACPPVARTALEFNPAEVDRLATRVSKLADAIRPNQPGEDRTVWVVAFASGAGSVGSSGLCWLERLIREVKEPCRVLFNSFLIADRGAVPRKTDSLALQHAHLTEIRHRARAPKVRKQ